MATPSHPNVNNSDDKSTHTSPTNEDSIDNLGDPEADGQFQRKVSSEDEDNDTKEN